MTDPGDSPDPDESELVRRLRRRAQELRSTSAATPAPEAEPEAETEPEPEPVEEPEPEPAPEPGPEPAASEDPWADPPEGHDDLLTQWAGEDHLETESPTRNWTPVYVVAVLVAAALGLFLLLRFAVGGDEGATSTAEATGEDAEAPSVTDADPPTLEDLTAEVTVPPGPEEGLTVADQGVTVVEDRFDPERREGTFAAIIDNPHPGWLAQGVQVEVEFLDEAGNPVGSDRAFIEVVLPEQRVAVGALFFDAPTVPVTGMDVTLDVARWRETEPFEGELTTSEVVTEEAEFSGVRTSFVLRSSFEEALRDVGVTAVYRDEGGAIVGGSDTFVDLVEPDTDTPVELSLLANLDVEQIASTELYPSAGFGFGNAADTNGG